MTLVIQRVIALTLVVALAGAPIFARAAESAPRIETLGTLPAAVGESSGVAASRAQAGLYWTHNDSGGGPRLYALAPGGALRATYLVQAARNEDWEDLALARCPSAEAWCLFIADTGDNLESRADVTIYVVREPTLPGSPSDRVQVTEPPHALRLRYADGPHDVEALAFDPGGNLLLISKGQRSSIHVYRVAREALTSDSATADLVELDAIEPRGLLGAWVTGAATSPARKRLVVRTYTDLYFYRFGPGGRLVADGPPCALGFIEPQGEGVDFLDERVVVLTSESRGGRKGQILRVTCTP